MTDAVGTVAVNVTADVTSLQLNLAKGAKATADFGAKAGKLGGAMSSMQGNARGLAQQLNQVAQQTAATGNFVQALAIQLPDMAGMFGAVGAAVGAVAGFALPALISALSSGEDQTKRTADAMAAMEKATSDFMAAAREAAAPTAELTAEYGAMADQMRQALDAQRAVAFAAAVDSISVAVDELRHGLMNEVLDSDAFGNTVIVGYQLADAFDMAANEADRFGAALESLATARGMEDQARFAAEAMRALDASYGSVAKMPAPLREAYSHLASIVDQSVKVRATAEGIVSAFDAAASAANGITSAVGGVVGVIADAAANAWNLAQGLHAAASSQGAAQAAFGMIGTLPTGPAGAPPSAIPPTLAPSRSPRPQLPSIDFQFGSASASGGGAGGGGSDDAAARLRLLQDQLAGEAELQTAEYERQLAELKEFREKKLLTEQEYSDLERQATLTHQQEMSDIQTRALNDRLGAYSGALGDLAALMDSGNRKLFGIGKAAAIAQAVVDGYQSAVAAWKHGMEIGGPGVAAAFTAASLAKTGALISSLKGTSIGGGGGSSGGSSSGPSFGASTPAQAYTANVTLVGDSFTGDQVAKLFRDLNEGLGRGFSINLDEQS